jgi:hypothetical protein
VRRVSRHDTVKPKRYPDAAGVDPAGIVGKRQGLPWETSRSVRTSRTTRSAMGGDGLGGVSRGRSTGSGRTGRAERFMCRENRPDDSMDVEL